MSENNNLSTTINESQEQTPAITPEAKPEVQSKQEAQQQPDKLGSQFAALSRKEKAARAKELELAAKAEQIGKLEQQYSELERLSAVEILERVAAKRGVASEDLIKDYIATKTGQPTADQALQESKDPAVQALAKKLEAQAKANQELQKKLEEKAEAEQRAQQQVQVQAVHSECLESASTSWSEESDYPLFFADQKDLASNVFQYCAARVQQYQQENGFPPDDADIAGLIKAAPELLLKRAPTVTSWSTHREAERSSSKGSCNKQQEAEVKCATCLA